MPWVGNTYSLPAGTTVSPNTTIQSSWANTLTSDLQSGMNFTRPVSRGGTGATSAAGARTNLDVYSKSETLDLKWALKPIGEIVYIDTSLTGVEIPPDDAGFIELTAGLDGSGQYNEGKLTGEAISGSGATLTATAVIDDADSPMNGQTISLINSEERVTYAGERAKAGDVFNDQGQQIIGQVNGVMLFGANYTRSGAFLQTTQGALSYSAPSGASVSGAGIIRFDSADSANARTGDRTRAKGQFLVAFLKYKDVA